MDEVRLSEYIEEADIKKLNVAQRSFVMSDPSIIADDETKS